MSSPDPNDLAGQGGPAGPTGAPPSEEELRAAYEAELDRIDAVDMIAQSAVSLLNIGARRLGPPSSPGGAPAPEGSRDLEQARDAIDGAAALLAILERRLPNETKPLKDALARLQMAYASEARAGAPAAPGGETASAGAAAASAGGGGASGGGEPSAAPAQAGQEPSQQQPDPSGPGPAESSGRLWVPGR